MTVMGQRTSTTAADLFVLIDREFRRRKPRECANCYVALPYRIDAPDVDTANWEIVPPSGCPWGCSLLLDEIVGEFQQLYKLNVNGRENGRDNRR